MSKSLQNQTPLRQAMRRKLRELTTPFLWDRLLRLAPAVPLPEGLSETQILEFLLSLRIDDASSEELYGYCMQDYRRFLHTYGMVRDLEGKALEFGANPYFTTMLMKKFTSLELTLANYFGPDCQGPFSQKVTYKDPHSGKTISENFDFNHFNSEEEEIPYPNDSFDVVLYCEIIEHLLNDPVKVLKEIKRILKPNGYLILTTPNVARLENITRIMSGANIYDPYSGYGPYGRHNREYNFHELNLLLEYLGFSVNQYFSADVHKNSASQFLSAAKIYWFVKHRRRDLGQYLFVKARNTKTAGTKKPRFLYRSYDEDELEG